jgi:hypothetical protein
MNRATIALVTLLTGTSLLAQTQPAPPPPSTQPRPPQGAQPELKNVQVLKGMSPPELIRAMQFMSASLGVNCHLCHVFNANGVGDFASDDKDEKKTAREMIKLVIDTNGKYFQGNTVVSCNTCHRGSTDPVNVPVLPISAPQAKPEEPATAEKVVLPTRDDIVSRYAKALGNIDQKAISSIELKGTRDMARGSAPIDVIVAGGRTRIVTTAPEGEMINVVTPDGGWSRDPRGTHAMPPMQLEGMRAILDALRLPMPSEIPADVRVSKDRVGDRDVWVLTYPYGTSGRQRLSFDAGTGLLLRRFSVTPAPVGRIPQQTDFDDYRDVGGFKLPFTVRFDSVDRGASRVVHYTEIRPNAKIDEKVFVQPQ